MRGAVRKPARDRAKESAELVKQASELPGVADVLRIYGQHERTLAVASAYQARVITTSTTGNQTV